jgi:hypothetical protein
MNFFRIRQALADALDTGFTGGIYEDGTADLFNFAIEGG